MKTALEVLQRALDGDDDGDSSSEAAQRARSFLEQTSSIYVLDATSGRNEYKLFGCWNFLHQALNEFDRLSQDVYQEEQLLLAQFATKVARRSNQTDQQLVQTCVDNYISVHSQEQLSQQQPKLRRLILENAELREIVMGRVAALAFDPANQKSTSNTEWYIVLDTYHKAVAANAVSNGPSAIRHLLCDWIIPSAITLPSFSVVSLIQHIGEESSSSFVPFNTQDTLQQLSTQVMARLVLPTLMKEATTKNDDDDSSHSIIVETSIRAIHTWCTVTHLSLAQIRHIASKINVSTWI